MSSRPRRIDIYMAKGKPEELRCCATYEMVLPVRDAMLEPSLWDPTDPGKSVTLWS